MIYAVHWESDVITQEWQFPLVPLSFRRLRSVTAVEVSTCIS